MAEITKELGRIPVTRGEYEASITYYKDNIVQYKRGSYQVVSESPIVGVPPINDKNIVNPGWTLFAGTLDAQDVVNQIKEQEAKSIQAVAAREAEILAKSDAAEVSFNNTGTSFSGTNVQNALKETDNKLSELESEVIYDVTANNDGTTFSSLLALLSSKNISTLIPTSVRHGGMSIRFVQSSDNKYVQYRLMKNTWSTTVSDWQGVDDDPTFGSDNLVKSGGVESFIQQGIQSSMYGAIHAKSCGMYVGSTPDNKISVSPKSPLYDGFMVYLPAGTTKLQVNNSPVVLFGGCFPSKPTIGVVGQVLKSTIIGNYKIFALPSNDNGTWVIISTKISEGDVETVLIYDGDKLQLQSDVSNIQSSIQVLPNLEVSVETLEKDVKGVSDVLFESAIDLSDNITIPKGSIDNSLSGSFTLMTWYKPTSEIDYPKFNITFQQASSGWSPYNLGEVTFYYYSVDRIIILVGTGTKNDMSMSLYKQQIVSDHEFPMCAVVRDYDNSTIKFYVEGQLVKTVTEVPQNIYLSKNLQLARSIIGNVTLLDYVLSDSDILAAYNDGIGYSPNNAVLHLTADNISGNKLVDGTLEFIAQSAISKKFYSKIIGKSSYGGIITPTSQPIEGCSLYIAKEVGDYINFGLTISVPGVYIVKSSGEDSFSVDTIEQYPYKNVETILTEDIYILKDQDFLLYNDAIINGLDGGLSSPLNYIVEYTCAIGKVTNRGFYVNSKTEQTQTLTIKVYSLDKVLLKTITSNLHIVSNDFTGKSGNILVIGDSTESGRRYVKPMYDYLQEHNGSGVTFVGTQGNASDAYKDEGYGGATFQMFLTGNRKRLYFTIADDNDEQFILYSQYSVQVGANKVQFELTEINRSTPGHNYVSGGLLSGDPTLLPNSGVMTKYYGSGSETLTYTAVDVVSVNPFWNTDSEQNDILYYKNKIGVQSIKMAYVILGINDVGYELSSVISNAISLYNFLAQECEKVIIVLTTDCANTYSAFGGQYGASYAASMISYKNKIYAIREKLIEEFQNNPERPKAKVMMLGGTVDRFYGYNHSNVAVSYYSNETEVVHTDSKHPNLNGQTQGGMSILGHLRSLL